MICKCGDCCGIDPRFKDLEQVFCEQCSEEVTGHVCGWYDVIPICKRCLDEIREADDYRGEF